jgi:hypothetical protein
VRLNGCLTSPGLIGYKNGRIKQTSFFQRRYAMDKILSKQDVIRKIESLSPDRLEEVAKFIEYLEYKSESNLAGENKTEHVAFGIWKDYHAAEDPAAYAIELRRKVEKRQDVSFNSFD